MVHKTLTLLIYLTAINVACFASVQNQRAPKSIKTTTADLQKQTARDTVKKSTKMSGSQPLFDLQRQLLNFTPVSPQATCLIERVIHPVDYSTGGVNISIPLHEIKTRDFSLPITLNCKTTGIKVSESATNVGLGWSLQAEPIISRQIKGMPDEQGYAIYNSLYGSTETSYLKRLNEGNYDEQPDIFYYSTLGGSGRFIFHRPLNSAQSQKFDPLFIPAAAVRLTKSNYQSAGFNLKDEQGNLYIYGDSPASFEQTASYTRLSTTTWKASKVISARGDMLDFQYESGSNVLYPSMYDYYAVEDGDPTIQGVHNSEIPYSEGYWLGVNGKLDYHYANGTYMVDDKQYVSEFVQEPYIRDLTYDTGSGLVYVKILKTITFPNGKIIFTNQNGRLIKMEIYERSALIKQIDFTYKSVAAYQAGRYVPTRIVITDKIAGSAQVYSFAYYEDYSYDPLSTKAVDFWDFYNGRTDNTNLVARQEISLISRDYSGDTHYAQIGGANREANLYCAQTYTIKSITYPTGSTDHFTYGLNKYTDNEGHVNTAGGLRIQTIKTTNRAAQTTDTRTFEYGLNQTESGRVNLKPDLQYFQSDHQRLYINTVSVRQRRYRVFSSHSVANLNYSCGVPVLYVDVVEKRGMVGSGVVKTVYHTNNAEYWPTYPGRFYPERINEWRYNKLVSRRDYIGTTDNPVRQIDYTYNSLSLSNAPAHQEQMRLVFGYNIVSWHDYASEDMMHYRYFYESFTLYGDSSNPYLATTSTTDYSGGTALTTTSRSTFGTTDWDARTGQPINVSITGSDNTTQSTSYKYPYHVTSAESDYGVAQRMIQDNDVSRKMEETYSSTSGGTTAKRIKYNYTLTGTSIPYQLSALQVSMASLADLKTIELYNRYDERGNLTQYTRQDGATVTILWGYNYQLPVAEVVGATYATVASKIPSYAALQTQDGATLRATINAIRSSLPSSMVTCYTYFPGRGVATKTDPSARMVTYQYSGRGELLKVIDPNGQTVESYEYNYVNN